MIILISWHNVFATEPQKNYKYEFSIGSGTYCFDVATREFDPSLVVVSTTFRSAAPDKLGSISDEALAVSKLLGKLKQERLTVSFFYIPTTFEMEVRDRIKVAAGKSSAWRKATERTSAGVLVQMLRESKAYNELQKVLLSNGLVITSITVEDIWAVTPPSSKVSIPQTWTTFISVSDAANSPKKDKSH
jgi:hypothetical protein